MNWLKEKIIGILVKKYVAGWIAALFAKVKGYKTQIGSILIVLITAAKHLGYIPPEFTDVADQVLLMIYGATGITAGDKLRRYWEEAKKIGDDVVAK